MKEKDLIKALESCVSEWDHDFDIDVEQEDHHGGYDYFSVVVTHRRLGKNYDFRARVYNDGNCEMDYYEDSWVDITMGNLFAYMWFEEVE